MLPLLAVYWLVLAWWFCSVTKPAWAALIFSVCGCRNVTVFLQVKFRWWWIVLSWLVLLLFQHRLFWWFLCYLLSWSILSYRWIISRVVIRQRQRKLKGWAFRPQSGLLALLAIRSNRYTYPCLSEQDQQKYRQLKTTSLIWLPCVAISHQQKIRSMSNASFLQEVGKRRTFAIISHPDAGKTTITEKVLLFGRAIQTAGTVSYNFV